MSADAHTHAHAHGGGHDHGSHGHDDHGHEEHEHRSVWFYAGIALFLGILTAVELGPLFDVYNLPALVLLGLSVVKFFAVVAFFMHLWDDPPIFTRVFGAPLIGGILMVMVLMTLFTTWFPSPRDDSFAVQERHWNNFNGECYSWLSSAISNRVYCASGCTEGSLAAGTCRPALDKARIAMHLGGTDSGPSFSIAGMSEADAKKTLIENGKALYEIQCVSCHGPEGKGTPGAYPPLAGSDYAGFKDPAQHAAIIVKGLNGAITVNGQPYNGNMAAFGQLGDLEIAAIATYERNAWGNNEGVVMPETVKAAR